MDNELISCIVPVYNVDKYLSRCLESLIKQTYENLEIIVVDDGSTDNCGKIIDEFSFKDNRVVALHKENGGLSDARNYGLLYAHGKYISFIDSDDWASPFYIENLYNSLKISNADLSISWFEKVVEGKKISLKCSKSLLNLQILDNVSCIEKMLYQDYVETSAWGKLYKRELFIDNVYPKGEIYEDILVTYECLKRSKIVSVIRNVDYYYFQRKDSIQNQSFNRKKLDGIIHFDILLKKIKCDFPSLIIASKCRYFSFLNNLVFQIEKKEDSDIKRLLWGKIITYRKSVIHNPKARKKARIAACLSYLGYGFLKNIYKMQKRR